MSEWLRAGGERRARVGSEMEEEHVLCRELMRCRACVARLRRVARSVRMDRGQYGRWVLEWRVGEEV